MIIHAYVPGVQKAYASLIVGFLKLKDLVDAIEDSNDAYLSKDGKLVVDFLQAIHAAEKRQAELDAHIFTEEKRKMKVWLLVIYLSLQKEI